MRRFVVAVAVAAAIVLPAGGASAHALVAESDPRDGARLERAPSAVTIRFTEEPERSLASIRVLSAIGTVVARGATAVPGDPRALRLALPLLERRAYTVAWRVVSRVDGHATAGAFTFGVGVSPAEAPPLAIPAEETPPTSALEAVGRWGFFAGAGLLIGVSLVAAVAFRPVPGPALRLVGGGWVVALGGVAALAFAQRGATGATWGTFTSTSVGRAIGWRAAALGVAGVALVVGRKRRWALLVVVAAGAVAVLVHVAAGHAATGDLRWAKVAAQWVHGVAGSVWLGGLAGVLGGLRGTEAGTRAHGVRRFSTTAGVALFLVLGTGVLRALNEIPSWSALTGTFYGRVVIAKLAGLVGLAGLGAVNRYRHVPRAHEGVTGLRAVSRAEVGIGAGVLVLAALLASLSPPRSFARAESSTGPLVVSGSDFGTSVRVELRIAPGTPGTNSFTVVARDFDSGEPIRDAAVSIVVAFLDDPSVGEATIVLEPAAAGEYRGRGSHLSLDGRWRTTIVVQRAADAVEIPLVVATRCTSRALPVAGQPTIHTVDLAGGGSAQGYVDPGRPGANEVHITYFGADGNELAVEEDVRMRATPPQGEPRPLEVRRLGPGHFVADAPLDAGRWRFDIVGTGRGDGVRACFEEGIEG